MLQAPPTCSSYHRLEASIRLAGKAVCFGTRQAVMWRRGRTHTHTCARTRTHTHTRAHAHDRREAEAK